MSEWQKVDKNKLELNKLYEFKGTDWSPFTCKGKVMMSSPNAPKKYRNKRKFYILKKDGSFEPDRDTYCDIEFVRDIDGQEIQVQP